MDNKRRTFSGMLIGSLVLMVGMATPVQAQQTPDFAYAITELDGVNGSGAGVNNLGWVAGVSTTADNNVHATLWRNGKPVDLKTLGGLHSAVVWPVKNDLGLVAGISHTAAKDPRGEKWSCSAFIPNTGNVCRGFVWQHGKMKELGTFGGTHGFAAGLNNRGQVVGWAETAEPDATCKAPQVLGFRAAVWDANTGGIRQLPPLAGDTTSAATAVNDFGQVVGISGICWKAVGSYSARQAVLWENGTAIPIGGLGAQAWNTPMAINAFGVVVGFANREGTVADAFNEEAFLWTKQGGIRPLGTLGEGENSQALGVNNLGQVVGTSRLGWSSSRAFLWANNRMIDLNDDAVDSGYQGRLLTANDINDFGVITGQATSADGRTVAYVATRICR